MNLVSVYLLAILQAYFICSTAAPVDPNSPSFRVPARIIRPALPDIPKANALAIRGLLSSGDINIAEGLSPRLKKKLLDAVLNTFYVAGKAIEIGSMTFTSLLLGIAGLDALGVFDKHEDENAAGDGTPSTEGTLAQVDHKVEPPPTKQLQ
ncbi:hypothetical protein FRB99_000668 [Tulasnella sp. 403]|nr:hypothetical protein FRB99_000668 [Tulasnella sp. 403]